MNDIIYIYRNNTEILIVLNILKIIELIYNNTQFSFEIKVHLYIT